MNAPFHWLEDATVDLAVTQTSGAAKLLRMPTGPTQVRVANSGAKVARIRKGVSASVTALATDMPILPGSVEVLTVLNDEKAPITHIAAICASGETTTLSFTTGAGV